MKNNNKIYIISSIFALASLILIIFFIWPVSQEIEKNSKDLVSAKNSIFALSAQDNETENFNKNYEIYEPNLEKIDQLFVDPNNPVDFIEFLENSAAISGVTSQISLPPSSSSSQQFIILQLVSKGSFSNLLNFIKKIESGPYLIEIENLMIQNSVGSAGGSSTFGLQNIPKDYSSRNIDATFSIKVFTKK